MSTKKGVCELCGFADDGYSIEENGTVMKVCKFCHDGYLERMGISPDDDKREDNLEMKLDLSSALADVTDGEELGSALDDIKTAARPKEEEKPPAEEESEDEEEEQIEANNETEIKEQPRMKVEPLTEEELNKVLANGHKKSRKAYETGKTYAPPRENMPAPREEQNPTQAQEKAPQKKARYDIMDEVNPRIDDERIKITSPEIPLSKDVRPKTNLDVEVAEYKNSVRFMDAFKYVFHPVVYAIFLGLVTATVTTILFVVSTWQKALVVLGGGIVAIGLSYFLMWYVKSRYDKDKRAYLLRIRQQEILFESMTSDCYRELKTKFTVIKSLGWLLNKLSVLLPLVVILGSVVTSVIVCFLYKTWLMPIILFGAIVAGILVYWIVKFAADMVTYKLDAERNQQIQQQTLLDILRVLKK